MNVRMPIMTEQRILLFFVFSFCLSLQADQVYVSKQEFDGPPDHFRSLDRNFDG